MSRNHPKNQHYQNKNRYYERRVKGYMKLHGYPDKNSVRKRAVELLNSVDGDINQLPRIRRELKAEGYPIK